MPTENQWRFHARTTTGRTVAFVTLAKDKEDAKRRIRIEYPNCIIDSLYNTGYTKAIEFYTEETIETYKRIVSRINAWQFTFFPKGEHPIQVSEIQKGCFTYRILNGD